MSYSKSFLLENNILESAIQPHDPSVFCHFSYTVAGILLDVFFFFFPEGLDYLLFGH